MPDSKSELVLIALQAALAATAPAGVLTARNAALPVELPAAGIITLFDGDPGEPEYLFSPPTWLYEHRAEVSVVVERPDPAARDALFDTLKQAVGAALAADRTLGGLCDWVIGEAPAPVEIPVDGADGLKAASIGVILSYATADPLA